MRNIIENSDQEISSEGEIPEASLGLPRDFSACRVFSLSSDLLSDFGLKSGEVHAAIRFHLELIYLETVQIALL